MKNSGKYVKATAVFTLAFAASGMMLSGCRIDTQKLTDGINDIEKIVKPVAEDIIPDEIWNGAAPTGTPIVIPEVTAAPVPTEPIVITATPMPTSTPIPTPTPMPERVDFSEFIKTELGGSFNVASEDFGESYAAEGTEDIISDFKGNRIAVEVKDNPAAQQAINLILNSYYLKAEGAYKEASARAASFYALNKSVDEAYHTEIKFSHSDNGRILSVVIEITVKQGSKTLRTETKTESFDMLTGQYVNLGTVSDNPSRLKVALINELNKERLAVKKTETGLKENTEEGFLPSETDVTGTTETADASETSETKETSTAGTSDQTDATSESSSDGELILNPDATEETSESTAETSKGKDKDKKKDNKDKTESKTTESDKEDSRESSEKTTVRVVNYTDIYIVIQNPGATSVTAQILGVTASGEVFTATCDLTPYKDLFNSYGKLVYGLSKEGN